MSSYFKVQRQTLCSFASEDQNLNSFLSDMLYIICILRILRVNFAKQMHQNMWYGMFALMSVCDICNLALWQCWIPTGKSVSLLEISHKITLLVSAFLLELEHLIYRVYKKKLNKPEIALRLCK